MTLSGSEHVRIHTLSNYSAASQQLPVNSYTVDFNLAKSADDIFYNYQISELLLISAPGSRRVNLKSVCGDPPDTCAARNDYFHIQPMRLVYLSSLKKQRESYKYSLHLHA